MLRSIQGCRALAALLVVFTHTGGTLAKEKYFGVCAIQAERIFSFGGQAGVVFFFVLSGFIITYVHGPELGCPDRVLPYLYKRAVRIYPTYITVFLVVYLSAVLTPSLRDTMPKDFVIVAKSLLLLPQDKSLVGGTGAPVLGVAWSLQYELVFYLFFALAMLNRWTFYTLIVAFSANFLFSQFLFPTNFFGAFFSSHLIFLFVMGAIASVAAGSSITIGGIGQIALSAAIAFFLIPVISYEYRSGPLRPVVDLAYGTTSAILLFALARYELTQRPKIGIKGLTLLGDSSYALYLIHVPIVSILCKVFVLLVPRTVGGAWFAFIVIVAACCITSVAFHSLIERRLLQIFRKDWGVPREGCLHHR